MCCFLSDGLDRHTLVGSGEETCLSSVALCWFMTSGSKLEQCSQLKEFNIQWKILPKPPEKCMNKHDVLKPHMLRFFFFLKLALFQAEMFCLRVDESNTAVSLETRTCIQYSLILTVT